MSDIALVFPPQWSPFQPPLSLPSLAAWLKRSGISVDVLDANIEFYDWLYGDACISLCRGLIEKSSASTDEKIGYAAILDAVPDFAADIHRLQRLGRSGPVDPDTAIGAHYLAINSMEILLQTISKLAKDFVISPFGFETISGNFGAQKLQYFVENPPPLLAMFVDEVVAKWIDLLQPKSIGISCIGQEQLVFTLLIGRRIKRLLNVPVFVGGTIFSRIFERGSLPIDWFDRYFDVIVRNEGEKPVVGLVENLLHGRPVARDVPGTVYADASRIIASPACAPLTPRELPVPDFDDLPLERYVTGNPSLPLLSSRGCYWGKCEFCHHGMVYGEKYGSYEAETVLTTVQRYAHQYGAKHFAFNDEAIPPKIARSIGRLFPDAASTSWAFTGLIKFEKFFESADFVNLRRIGFRSLYVGLESASERVLALMKKPNKKATIVRNLKDATNADIWMHCFLFFGFPGETENDAKETHDFIIEHSDIIGSFGSGSFSLEHNAPIFRHLKDFPVQLEQTPASSVNVYYDYTVTHGISAARADELAADLSAVARHHPKYFASAWIPREHLLSLLACMTPEQLVAAGDVLRSTGGVPRAAKTREIFSSVELGQNSALVAINRATQRVLRLEGASADLFRMIRDENLSLVALRQQGPEFYERLIASSVQPATV
jgi:hypothetical protein